MPIEDFTTYSETDPGSTVTKTSDTITWALLSTRNTSSYVYKDFGAGYFGGDFSHRFEVTATGYGGVTPYASVWGLANAVDDFQGIDDSGGDYQSVVLVNSGGTYFLQLRICEDGGVSLSNQAISVSTKYYVTVERDDDGGTNGTGRLTLRVYTGNYYGESGAVEIGTVTLDCGVGEQNDFRYLYATSSFNTGDAGKTLNATIENLDLLLVVELESAFPTATALTNIPEPKEQFGFEELNGVLYAVAGITTGDTHSKTTYAFDISAGTWSQKTDAPVSLQSPVLRAVNGKLYLIGGYRSDLGTYYDTVYEYDPDLDSWTAKTSMPVAREDHASAVINDKIYIFGGLKSPPHTLVPYVDIYDPALDTWGTRRAWAAPRALGDYACSYEYNGKIYIVSSTADMSGYSADLKATTEVFEYDPETDIFTAKTNCPEAVCYKEVSNIDGVLYVVSGATDDTVTYSLYDQVYDISLDLWKKRPTSSYSARGISMAAYSGSIYICGGFDNDSGQLDSFYRLTPPPASSISGASGTLSLVSRVDPVSSHFFNLPYDITREQ